MRADLAVFRRLPRWVSLVAGLACVVIGVVLVTRPFTSLSVLVALVAAALLVTGVIDLASARLSPSPVIAAAAGVGWLVAGIVVLAWPGVTAGGAERPRGRLRRWSRVAGSVVALVARLPVTQDRRRRQVAMEAVG